MPTSPLAPLFDLVDRHVNQLLLTRHLPSMTTPHTCDPLPPVLDQVGGHLGDLLLQGTSTLLPLHRMSLENMSAGVLYSKQSVFQQQTMPQFTPLSS